ncbi:MAG: sel1 repeat family protein [Crocinitomicaceae bacterium]|nr:sel1 repeat family protein [Crocinitomicaceae bacterium]
MTKWFCIVGITLISCGQSGQETNSPSDPSTISDTDNQEQIKELDVDSIHELEKLGRDSDIKDMLSEYSDHDLSDSMLFLKSKLNYEGIQPNYTDEDDSLETNAYFNIENLCLSGYLDACAYSIYCDTWNWENPMSKEERHEKWLALADSGNALAMYYLGTNAPTQPKESYVRYTDPKWLKKSCELGNIEACDHLAFYYKYDNPNEKERIKYLNKCVEYGRLSRKIELSLISLQHLTKYPNKENYNQFREKFLESKQYWHNEANVYFPVGEILFNSKDNSLKTFGARVVILTKHRASSAKSFIQENGIKEENYVPLNSFESVEPELFHILKEYCGLE